MLSYAHSDDYNKIAELIFRAVSLVYVLGRDRRPVTNQE